MIRLGVHAKQDEVLPKAPPCPICKRTLPTEGDVPRPFCSQRCRTIDLGGWLSGAYRLSRELQEDDLDELPGASADEEGFAVVADDGKAARHRRH
ncbi:MAG TPA: DNA gyrase inhibitor YacG [Polyangia bacterium]